MTDLGVFPICCPGVSLIVSLHCVGPCKLCVQALSLWFTAEEEERNIHNGFLKHIQQRAIISGWRFTLLSDEMRPSPWFIPLLSVHEDECGYKKTNNRLTEMNRQTKQRGGRLQWSDDSVFIVAHAYLPAISNIQPHHHTKGGGQPLWKDDFHLLRLLVRLQQHSTWFSAPFLHL